MTVYLFGLSLTGAGLLGVLLALKCADHAETKRELDIAVELGRQERQRRQVAEHVLNRINTNHLPPALVPLERRTYELSEVLGE